MGHDTKRGLQVFLGRLKMDREVDNNERRTIMKAAKIMNKSCHRVRLTIQHVRVIIAILTLASAFLTARTQAEPAKGLQPAERFDIEAMRSRPVPGSTGRLLDPRARAPALAARSINLAPVPSCTQQTL